MPLNFLSVFEVAVHVGQRIMGCTTICAETRSLVGDAARLSREEGTNATGHPLGGTNVTSGGDTRGDRVDVSAGEFRALFEGVCTWGRWVDRGERGALNYLTPDRVANAARLVTSGITVTLSRPLATGRRIDNPRPADHYMTMLPDMDAGPGAERFAKDYVGLDYHNEGHSHVDALCHVAYRGADAMVGTNPPNFSLIARSAAHPESSSSSTTPFACSPTRNAT